MPNHDSTFGDFLAFLKDEYAAVLSDCVSSAFEVDSECHFSRMVSTFSDSQIMPAKLNEGSPYRFANVICHYAVNEATAILLLVNGDILVCRNGAVLFVKRNGKWLNFSFSAFEHSFLASEYRQKVSRKLLKAIFSSCIDVSFSHCGGIIALIKNKELLTVKEPGSLPILSLFDDVSNSISSSSLAERWQKEHDENKEFKFKEEEMKKRLLKREMIKSIIAKESSFQDINRKIRCELIGLDGATLFDSNGRIISFGAIIQNDSGSSGGGRGAAAKKLSSFGVAIKISTDGYIDAYCNQSVFYSIK